VPFGAAAENIALTVRPAAKQAAARSKTLLRAGMPALAAVNIILD
jgi:hypothetical protein